VQPLTLADIRPPASYEPVRAEARRQVIELKRERRISVGDQVTLVFENRDTVRGVIEEVLRAERIEASDRIAEELETFNALLPGEGELTATLYLEITDPAEMSIRRDELRGIDTAVTMRVDGAQVERLADPGFGEDARTGSVHHLRFRLSPAQRDAFAGGEVSIRVDHPGYGAAITLTEAQRAALAADLMGG
jgi:hypothetical protein